jgi:hypothetical protein
MLLFSLRIMFTPRMGRNGDCRRNSVTNARSLPALSD